MEDWINPEGSRYLFRMKQLRLLPFPAFNELITVSFFIQQDMAVVHLYTAIHTFLPRVVTQS